MLEALEYYQSLAQKFQGQILTGPGILVVLTGFCIWLAGLRWRKVLGALAGAAIAAAGVVMAVDNYPAGAVLTACTIGLAAGAIVSEIVLGLFGAIAGAGVVMIILAGGSAVGEFPYPTWPQYEQSDVIITASEAVKITDEMTTYLAGRAKKVFFSAGIAAYGGAALAAIIIAAAALIATRLFIAAASAIIGSAVIFIGMIMLLFYKGSEPISYIAASPGFYTLVCGAMTVFGTVIQLLLSPPKPQNIQINVKKKKDGV